MDSTVSGQKGAQGKSVTLAAKYLLVHAGFLAVGVYGAVYGVAWCWNVFRFTFWLAVVTATLVSIGKTKAKVRKRGRSVPAWLDQTVDVSICIGLAATAHFWMAGFWFWQLMCSEIIHAKPEEASEADSVGAGSSEHATGVSSPNS